MITKNNLFNIRISDLIPYSNNPRKNDKSVLSVKKSLEEYGFVKNSIVIDEKNILITGHTTLKAIKLLGWDEVPEVTQVFGLTEAQKKGYRLADNRTQEDSEWDEDLLAEELKKIENLYTGFNAEELKEIENNVLPYEIEDLIQELDLNDAIDAPIWIVIRAPEDKKTEIETAIKDLKEGIHVERSYQD